MKVKFFSKPLALFIATIFLSASFVQADDNDQDLLKAFNSLKQSMGEVIKPDQNADLDQALEANFNPLPLEVRHSKIALDDIDGPQSRAALKSLTEMDINDEISVNFEQKGAALSLTLWSGSRDALIKVLTNILKQLYADKDARDFRFEVDSSPIPYLKAEPVDLNAKERKREEEREAAGRMPGFFVYL